jgi:hypothetical protein
MRLTGFVLVVVLLSPALAVAQEWDEYLNRDDRFTVNMAGQPKVEVMSWPSEYGLTFPGRVYSFTRGPEKYSITVIDYNDAEKRYAEKPHPPSFRQAMYWQIDILASVQYAATRLYRKRQGSMVTYDAWHYIDLVPGHQLHLTNGDGTRTIAGIYLHDNRLYILDATVPAKAPEPALFVQSLGFIDADGQRIRYNQIYANRLPPVTLAGRGRGGPGNGGNVPNPARGGAN